MWVQMVSRGSGTGLLGIQLELQVQPDPLEPAEVVDHPELTDQADQAEHLEYLD